MHTSAPSLIRSNAPADHVRPASTPPSCRINPFTDTRSPRATALIASGWMQGVADGYLDDAYLLPGLKSYQAVVDSLELKDGLLSMPLISAPTIAIQGMPYLGYKYTPRGNDWTYGLAALFFAALSYKRLADARKLP